MVDWPRMTLREAGVSLIDCVHATPKAVSEGYPYVAIPQMRNGHIDLASCRRISEADFTEWTRKARPRPHDVILSRRTNPGVIAVDRTNSQFALGQNLVLLRADGTVVLPRFLRWLVSGPHWWEQIEKFINVGAVFSSLRCADVPKFELPIPPLDEQEGISGLLDDLDDKIELNRGMNETLEAMAQAIFRDWFVDFGPTRRKIDGATDPVEIMGGLVTDPDRARELADLFPGRLGHEGLPEGWKEGTLGDIARAVGTTISPSQIVPDTPYIGLEHMPRRSIALEEWEAASKVSSNKTAFRRGQVLFGKLRPYFHKVGIAPVDGVCSTDIVVLDAADHHARAMIAACVSTDEFVAFTDQGSTGTKMPRTSWGNMKKYKIALAPDAVVQSYSAIVSPLMDKIVMAIHENRTLAANRDLLLPKLVSGEIRLRDADAVLEAAQ